MRPPTGSARFGPERPRPAAHVRTRANDRPARPRPRPSTRQGPHVATEVELPQLGESVTEGVITAWLVEVGDEVEVDQALVEISTDKVDTEIPSPVAGTVQELKA
ncbi:hypothetical protein FTX61_12610, partial [Nitriliruptoraceae bacterium ZYF776]|nr:hypothetical protein [Profundirhabdus halotolerans]